MMPRYVDIDVAEDYLLEGYSLEETYNMIPADVEEVKHGYWIEDEYNEFYPYKCNLCGDEAEVKYKYCHCGAKMDGCGKEKNNGET